MGALLISFSRSLNGLCRTQITAASIRQIASELQKHRAAEPSDAFAIGTDLCAL